MSDVVLNEGWGLVVIFAALFAWTMRDEILEWFRRNR